jgi:hypothetical protein
MITLEITFPLTILPVDGANFLNILNSSSLLEVNISKKPGLLLANWANLGNISQTKTDEGFINVCAPA